MACGALKELTPKHGEIKSMRTSCPVSAPKRCPDDPDRAARHRRQRGYERVSLETGTKPGFDAAVAIYRRLGFVEGGPLGDYRVDAFSRFMTKEMKQQICLNHV